MRSHEADAQTLHRPPDIDSRTSSSTSSKELLRFLTCGSVDDGKSTLIGRLLYDTQDDLRGSARRRAARQSAKHGTTGGEIDLALLTDGLQGRARAGHHDRRRVPLFLHRPSASSSSPTRPGHEQYTRNMATGASTCDLAIILIDARHGVHDADQAARVHRLAAGHQARRRRRQQDGPRRLLARRSSSEIKRDYRRSPRGSTCRDLHFIPMSALKGDNVVEPSANMPWYDGSTLLHYLENVHIASRPQPDRLPLPGAVRQSARTSTSAASPARSPRASSARATRSWSLPSGSTSRVKSIVTYDGELDEAFAPMSVTLTLDGRNRRQPRRHARAPGNVPRVDQQFEAMIVWMAEEPLRPASSTGSSTTTQVVRRRSPRSATASTSTRCTARPPPRWAQRNRPLRGPPDQPICVRRLPPTTGDRRVHRHRPADEPTRSAPA